MAYYDPIAWDGISGLGQDALDAKAMLEAPPMRPTRPPQVGEKGFARSFLQPGESIAYGTFRGTGRNTAPLVNMREPRPPQVGEKGFARSFLQPGESIAYGTFRGTGRNTAPLVNMREPRPPRPRVDIPADASPGRVIASLEVGRRPRPPLPVTALANGFGPAPAAGVVQRSGPGKMARINVYSQNPKLDPAALDAIERVVDAEAGVSGVAEVSPADLRIFRETLPGLKDTQGTTKGLREIAARVESKVGREMETGRSVLEGLAGEDRARPAGDFAAAGENLSPLTRGLGREAATRLSAALAPEREKQKEHLEKIKRLQALAKWMGVPEDEIMAMSEGALEGNVEGLIQSGQLQATLTHAQTAQAAGTRAETAAAREVKNAAAAQAAATSEDKVKAYVTAGGDDPQVIEAFQREMRASRQEGQEKDWEGGYAVEIDGKRIPMLRTSPRSAVPVPAEYRGDDAPAGAGPVLSADGRFYRSPGDGTWKPLPAAGGPKLDAYDVKRHTERRRAIQQRLEALATETRAGNRKAGWDIWPAGQTFAEERQTLEAELAGINAVLNGTAPAAGGAADSSGTNGEEGAPREFASEAAAEAAGLPAGTIVVINGRRARIK